MMKKSIDNPPLSQTDKLCLVALAGVLITITLIYELTDGAVLRQAQQEDKPPEITITAPAVGCTPLVEAIETAKKNAQDDLYDETIPLSRELQAVLMEACEENNVPMCLALGVIYAESRFDPDADNGLSYGLMGLNGNYYPSDLTPAENIRAGVSHLAGQIERYDGDIQAALRAYNRGYDDGDRVYAKLVLDASEKWGNG